MNSGIPEQIKQAIKLAIVGAWPEALKRYAYSPHPSDESYMETPEQSAEAAAEILLTALAPHFTQQQSLGERMETWIAEYVDRKKFKDHACQSCCDRVGGSEESVVAGFKCIACVCMDNYAARLNTEIKTK